MNVRTKHIPQHMLYLNGVTVSFDGFKALNDLSFMVAPGELRAIIGPNGAGKTTMMDVITGKVKPNTGDVFFATPSTLPSTTKRTLPIWVSGANSRSPR